VRRREFLAAGAVSLQAAGDRIRSIAAAPVECRFHKFIAMNSYDPAPKGQTLTNTLVRIRTGDGAEGVGEIGYTAPDTAFQQALRTLIGADPLTD
jgi:hypothetical protein